jgi:hypothetical protein
VPYNSIIDRAAADALIPVATASEIITATTQQSAALPLCRTVSMGAGQQRLPVLAALPQAYFVAGDTLQRYVETTAAFYRAALLRAAVIKDQQSPAVSVFSSSSGLESAK